MCSKGITAPAGCIDHNIVATTRKAKVPKVRQKVIHKRSYKIFCQESFCTDVNNLCWSDVYQEDHPDDAIKAL